MADSHANAFFGSYAVYMVLPIIAVSILLVGCSSPKPVENGKYDSLAKCLTANGAIMYGTDWCPHCKNQKAAFGSSFEFINFVNCDNFMTQCKDAGVEGYPTWAVNGTNYAGEQNLYELAKNAGCVEALLNNTNTANSTS